MRDRCKCCEESETGCDGERWASRPEQVRSELRLNEGRPSPARTCQRVSGLKVMSSGVEGPGDIGPFCCTSKFGFYSEWKEKTLKFIFLKLLKVLG